MIRTRLNKNLAVGHNRDAWFTEDSSFDRDVSDRTVRNTQRLAGTLHDRLSRRSSLRALSDADDVHDRMDTPPTGTASSVISPFLQTPRTRNSVATIASLIASSGACADASSSILRSNINKQTIVIVLAV